MFIFLSLLHAYQHVAGILSMDKVLLLLITWYHADGNIVGMHGPWMKHQFVAMIYVSRSWDHMLVAYMCHYLSFSCYYASRISMRVWAKTPKEMSLWKTSL